MPNERKQTNRDARSLQLTITDPSGETRRIPLDSEEKREFIIGRALASDVVLRDPSAASDVARLWAAHHNSSVGGSHTSEMDSDGEAWWVRLGDDAPADARMGDLPFREARLLEGVPLQLGPTRILLECRAVENPLPPFPSGVRPWLTRSDSGRELLWTTRKAAATPLSIYIAGETGTGKEVIAQLVHAWSERAAGPFVPLHCGALPPALAESELFGHVKGAFTGAIHQRPGALLQAHGGTLFLDEVGDLPLEIQVKLLRFLENGEIRAVGADRASRADVRLVCATHLPLKKLVEEGRFRRDLYYRLASVTVEIPTLRSRPGDIELLSRKFASELNRGLSPRAMLRLKAHSWPGNVRELRHSIERAGGLAGPFTPVLTEDAFSFLLTAENIEAAPELETGSALLTLAEMERLMVLKALRLAEGNRAEAARILGVARSTLFEMIKRHSIQGPRRSVDWRGTSRTAGIGRDLTRPSGARNTRSEAGLPESSR